MIICAVLQTISFYLKACYVFTINILEKNLNITQMIGTSQIVNVKLTSQYCVAKGYEKSLYSILSEIVPGRVFQKKVCATR